MRAESDSWQRLKVGASQWRQSRVRAFFSMLDNTGKFIVSVTIYKTGVINDPLGLPTVPVLKFGTDGRMDGHSV